MLGQRVTVTLQNGEKAVIKRIERTSENIDDWNVTLVTEADVERTVPLSDIRYIGGD